MRSFFVTAGLLVLVTACQVSVSTGGDDPPKTIPPGQVTTGDGDAGGGSSTTDPPPGTELNYVACLSQLAFGDVNKVLSFYAPVERTADSVSVSLKPLATENNAPPKTVTSLGTVGEASQASSPLGGGQFTLDLGKMTIPGAANPISGRDLVIEAAKLTGTLSCAHLSGDVTQPVQITLEPAQNTCRFFIVRDGDPAPKLTAAEFNCGK